MHVVAVLNRDGGTLRTMDLDAFTREAISQFELAGHTLDCRVVDGKDVEFELGRAARASQTDWILAGGGDGTISTAAGIAFETGKPLAVLPVGTMNLFARALGIPLDVHVALTALAQGEVKYVDIATANGRPFVHQFGVGIHARLVRIRDGLSYNSQLGKMFASLRAIGAAAINPPRFVAELHVGGEAVKKTVSGIAVSNNPLGDGRIHADRLDQGVLGVYVASPVTSFALVRLALSLLVGTWRNSPMVWEKEVSELVLHFPKRKRGAKAVVDGELLRLDREVKVKIHPLGIKVIVPKTG
jgi:diacylglycerol kinase family enzyme